MTARIQTRTYDTPATRENLPAGVLYANIPDRQLGIHGNDTLPVDLLAVRFFSPQTTYTTGEVVVTNSHLMRAVHNVSAGPYNAADWELIDGMVPVISATEPVNVPDGTFWLNTANPAAPELYIYSASASMFLQALKEVNGGTY